MNSGSVVRLLRIDHALPRNHLVWLCAGEVTPLLGGLCAEFRVERDDERDHYEARLIFYRQTAGELVPLGASLPLRKTVPIYEPSLLIYPVADEFCNGHTSALCVALVPQLDDADHRARG